MLKCPICKSEYQEGSKICSDCHCELIEVPDVSEKSNPSLLMQFLLLVLGVLLIMISPIISYQLTSIYFMPGGFGTYDNDQFLWMLKAFHISFLFTGGLLCVLSIVYWILNRKSS